MKLTAILLFLACMIASATGNTQNITISVKNASLEKVFAQIKKQTGYTFLYKDDVIKKAGKVDLTVSNVSIEAALQICFKGLPLNYRIFENKTIVVAEKQSPNEYGGTNASPDAILAPPPIDVHGRILNENGEPVIATVTVKGTKIATSTNDNGEFQLNGINDNVTLIITASNIETREINLNGRSDLAIVNVKMKVENLHEIVINKGYYSTSQKLNTGNVAKVTSPEIQKQPVSNPLQALQGRVPGMIINQNTGVPGGSISVQIRGLNSIDFSGNPLYVIDGVPYASELLSNAGIGITSKTGVNGGNPLSFINPADIESIEVLKDADATAIYGSRGANGVVLITTKRGKAGPMTVDVNLSYGIGKVASTMNLLNREQYLKMRREAFANDGVTPGLIDRDLNGNWDSTRFTDWQKIMIGNTATYLKSHVAFSGGAANSKYLVAGTYAKETSVFPKAYNNFSDQKAALNFFLSQSSANKRLNLTLSGLYMNDNNKLPRQDMTQFIFGNPVAPKLYNQDGSLNWQYLSTGVFTYSNPFAQLLKKYTTNTNNLIGNMTIGYKILDGLDFKTSLGYTSMFIDEINTVPIASLPPTFPAALKIGNANFVHNNTMSWIVEPQLSYFKVIGKGSLSALVGTTLQQNHSQGEILSATGYVSDLLLENMQAAPTVKVSTFAQTKYKYNAVFGRLGYNWQAKYLGNFTIRRDGSSRFGPERQFHNFMALGVGWIFSSERFSKRNMSFLSFGKIRGSYGTTGNDGIGDYKFLDLYSVAPDTYQTGVGLYPGNLFNPELAWEETKKFEIGIELGFLHDRIFLEGSIYRNRSENQLLSKAIPAMTGFSIIATNLPAKVENKGLEFVLNTINVSHKNFNWRTSFNFTSSQNKLVEFPDFKGSGYDNYLVIGQPLNINKLYHFVRVNPQTGIYEFDDGNKGTTTRPDTAAAITMNTFVDINPKFYGGFGNIFRLKGFELDVFFQFVKQTGKTFLVNPNFTPPGRFGQPANNQPTSVLDRWQKSGDNTLIQRYSTSSFNDVAIGYNNMMQSNLSYGDASFVRLKNLSISYRFPDVVCNRLHLQNFRVYVTGQNLWTATKYKGLDPETQTVTNLPPLKVLSGGIQIIF